MKLRFIVQDGEDFTIESDNVPRVGETVTIDYNEEYKVFRVDWMINRLVKEKTFENVIIILSKE